MTKHEWIKAVLAGNRDVPTPQHWMSFFHGDLARKLTPENCHYYPMWIYDVPEYFDPSPMGADALDRMIAFNNYTGRCFACLGKGANLCFGHGGPGEFFSRMVYKNETELVVEYETGVRAKVQFKPHFYYHFDHPIKTMDDLKDFVLPDPSDPNRYAGFAEDVKYLKTKGEYVVASLNGFFSGLHYFLRAYTDTLMALIDDPGFIEAMLVRLGEWNLTAARKMMECGVDCIKLCDDLGSKQAMLMAPRIYRQFFKPWHKKLCDLVHGMGGDVHLHSHGAIGKILDDLVECGFDFINPFDPEEKHDINHLMENYSKHFIVVGGFPAHFWEWQPGEQEAYLEKIGQLARRFGRMIFMDSGGIPENVTKTDFDRVNAISRRVRGVKEESGAV